MSSGRGGERAIKTLAEWHRAGSRDAEVLKRCKEAVCAAFGPAKVILYGSRARQEVAWDHDMDLVVLLPGPVSNETERGIRQLLHGIGLDSEVVISALVMDEKDFHPEGDEWSIPWSRNVSREGIIA